MPEPAEFFAWLTCFDCFKQGYQIVINLEELLFKGANGEECENEFKKVTETYNCDLDKDLLETQLLLFRAKWKKEFKGDKIVLHDIVEFMRQDGYCDLLSEVSTVLQLILVLPATNAEWEMLQLSKKSQNLPKKCIESKKTQSPNDFEHLWGGNQRIKPCRSCKWFFLSMW